MGMGVPLMLPHCLDMLVGATAPVLADPPCPCPSGLVSQPHCHAVLHPSGDGAMSLGFCPHLSTLSKTYQLGTCRVAGQQRHPKCHLYPLSPECERLELCKRWWAKTLQ